MTQETVFTTIQIPESIKKGSLKSRPEIYLKALEGYEPIA